GAARPRVTEPSVTATCRSPPAELMLSVTRSTGANTPDRTRNAASTPELRRRACASVERRERLLLEAELPRVLGDDPGGEEARHPLDLRALHHPRVLHLPEVVATLPARIFTLERDPHLARLVERHAVARHGVHEVVALEEVEQRTDVRGGDAGGGRRIGHVGRGRTRRIALDDVGRKIPDATAALVGELRLAQRDDVGNERRLDALSVDELAVDGLTESSRALKVAGRRAVLVDVAVDECDEVRVEVVEAPL